nr:hypothetical protein Iba_chr09bCG14360 [Ipomoea batatas]
MKVGVGLLAIILTTLATLWVFTSAAAASPNTTTTPPFTRKVGGSPAIFPHVMTTPPPPPLKLLNRIRKLIQANDSVSAPSPGY